MTKPLAPPLVSLLAIAVLLSGCGMRGPLYLPEPPPPPPPDKRPAETQAPRSSAPAAPRASSDSSDSSARRFAVSPAAPHS